MSNTQDQTYETLRIAHDGAVATITVDRPKSLNAINSGVIRDLDAVLDTIGPATRVVILTGGGEKAFVAGADIAEMSQKPPEWAEAFSREGHRVFHRLEQLPQVTIAALNGFALGGGLELAMCCDLLYAADSARMGQPEVNLGVLPGFGGTQRLPRLVGPQRARELLFTGDMIDAATAERIGLVCRTLPKAELLEYVRGVARKIASKGPLAVAACKRVVADGAHLPLMDANHLEARAFGASFATADTREGMAAYLDKRPANFVGA